MTDSAIGKIAVRHGEITQFEDFLRSAGFTPETTECDRSVLSNCYADKRIYGRGMLQVGITIILVDSQFVNKERLVKYWQIKI